MAEGRPAKPKLQKCATVPTILPPPFDQSPLPPAVVLVDSKGYVHSKKVNNYLVGGTLGEGSFAKVKEAFHVLVGEKVALKIIDKDKALLDPYVAKNFKREAKLLQKVNHPNIIKLYEVIETKNNYYLITELCSGGEVMKYIYKHKHLSEEETKKFIKQIVSAIDHLHKAGIIHRDLKVENLMLDSSNNVKLIDFGLSNEEFLFDDSGNEIHCRTQCGSPAYAAPELLGQKEYNKAADIWSIGVNMYAMLTGCLPFTVEPFNITALHAKMLQNKMNPIPEHLSENCKDLLKRMLVARPNERITIEEIFAHPWLNDDPAHPFKPFPYPSILRASEINDDVIEHMTAVLDVGTPMEIRGDLMSNRATSLYAIYCLLCSRLARYERDYPTKITRPHNKKGKKKLSKDHGFYDCEDIEVASIATAPAVFSGNRRENNGVILRQGKSRQGRGRPVSDDFSKESTLPANPEGKRLSDICEERRSSMPEEVMKKGIEQLREKKARGTKPVSPRYHHFGRISHPQTKHSFPLPLAFQGSQVQSIDMSPPTDPCEFDIPPSHTTYSGGFSRRRSRTMPKDLSKMKISAWGSNPPSRMGSRQSSLSIMPPLKNKESSFTVEPEKDELEFHDVGPTSPGYTNGVSFFVNTPTPPPQTDSTHLPPLNTHKSPRRRNGWVLPANGDYVIKTDLQVGAIISELLRTTHNMNMRAEPQTANMVKCEHKSVTFEIGVRKKSVTTCTLHFEWLSGGSSKHFQDVCSEILRKIHV